MCKVCQRIRNRELYQANREKRLAKRRAYYLANRERCIEAMRVYDQEHREEKLARLKAYREAHREEAAARTRAWMKANPEKARAYKQRRRARKMAVPNEPIDPQRVYFRDHGLCGICGLKVQADDWHLDHIIPLSKGGPHVYDNVQVSHPFCNMSKRDRIEDDPVAA